MMQPPRHGGNPLEGRGVSLNVATGINPWPWPMPEVPSRCFTELPYDNSRLRQTAADYYRVDIDNIALCAGSQAIIQLLPRLLDQASVLVPRVAYEEHAYRWSRAGHTLNYFSDYREDKVLEDIHRHKVKHLVLVSPNNPDGTIVDIDVLRRWLRALPADGCLILDQAFADGTPDSDARELLDEGNILILRSVGKFWGLPGLRLGAVLANSSWIDRLESELGPWPICGAAQYLGERLYADRGWQLAMQQRLVLAAEAQSTLLEEYFHGRYTSIHRQLLFTTFRLALPEALGYQQAAFSAGIHTRVYHCGSEGYMRWGLAADQKDLAQRLNKMFACLGAA